MRYLYIHNFRGFSETLVPLKRLTFLLGENSTGKTSLLKLLYVMYKPLFWFDPAYGLEEAARDAEVDLRNYRDVVSAWSSDKSSLRVGILQTNRANKQSRISCAFAVYTFRNDNGTPYAFRYAQFNHDLLTQIERRERLTKYKTTQERGTFPDETKAVRFFRRAIRRHARDTHGFAVLKDVPPRPPLAFALGRLADAQRGAKRAGRHLKIDVPFGLENFVWQGPIRTRPQRFYDATKRAFSPEGEHTPDLLRRQLRLRTKSKPFVRKLSAFGRASGLFQTVRTHSFGGGPQAPFEVLVAFRGAKLNLTNVGYGVTQILPLIVECLCRPKGHWFGVQQPEIHLHPRAQAALGDLIAELAVEKRFHFLVETHSEFLVDRCRLSLAKRKRPPDAQVLFFERTPSGNKVTALPIAHDGKYPSTQPAAFKDFFVKEEMKLLEL